MLRDLVSHEKITHLREFQRNTWHCFKRKNPFPPRRTITLGFQDGIPFNLGILKSSDTCHITLWVQRQALQASDQRFDPACLSDLKSGIQMKNLIRRSNPPWRSDLTDVLRSVLRNLLTPHLPLKDWCKHF